ncbi:MAG: OB-fold nucleic acid binding domain-containing protein, partial [bacterium]
MIAYIDDIAKYSGEEVTLRGWLYNSRSSGKLIFLLLRDGTGIIQCVVSKSEVTDEEFRLAETMDQESSFEVDGV